MTPSSPSSRRSGLIRWWPAIPGLALGLWLGYQIGYTASRGGMEGIGAIFLILIAGGLALFLGLTGAILRAITATRGVGRGLLMGGGTA